MSFSTLQVQFLQRLVSERPAQRKSGVHADHFAEHYGVGRSVGRHVDYSESDHQRAELLLRNHDLPVHAFKAQASRADVAAYGGLSEKQFSEGPHAQSIAVRFVGNCTLNGAPLTSPQHSYTVLYPEQASQVQCDRIMVVENLEALRRLEDYRWISYDGLAVMGVYRGDPQISQKEAASLICSRSEPLWAFVDFDPAGLGIANALPNERLQRIVLPPMNWLRTVGKKTIGRQLFETQYRHVASFLDASKHPDVQSCWKELLSLQGGVTQEQMLASGS